MSKEILTTQETLEWLSKNNISSAQNQSQNYVLINGYELRRNHSSLIESYYGVFSPNVGLTVEMDLVRINSYNKVIHSFQKKSRFGQDMLKTCIKRSDTAASFRQRDYYFTEGLTQLTQLLATKNNFSTLLVGQKILKSFFEEIKFKDTEQLKALRENHQLAVEKLDSIQWGYILSH